MEKYENMGVVGEGSYGLVLKCRHRETGQLVAIKKFIETEEDVTVRKMALREIRMLKKLRHENLVNMIEVFRRKRRFYLVFEFMDHTILDELEMAEGGLGQDKTREHVFQVARGIDFCHYNNIIHRDIKPENVLVSNSGVIKLCDFGFARLLSTSGELYTDYVATRWYRAPELLVGDSKYGKEVDIWAIGCLFAEMLSGEPLFPGESDIDQLFQIIKVMGKLSNKHQHLVGRNPMFKGLKRNCEDGGRPLTKMFPLWSPSSLEFLSSCLKMDPHVRPTSAELLKHPFIVQDNFPERFLPELRQRIVQEFQGNPLLRKYQSTVLLGSAPRRSQDAGDERASMRRASLIEPARWKISLIGDNGSDDSRRPSIEMKPLRRSNGNGEPMEISHEENENRFCFQSSEQKSARDGVAIDVQAVSPAPFQSLPYSSDSHRMACTEYYSNTPVQSVHYSHPVLHPSINNLSFGSGGTKRSPLPPSTRRDSISNICKTLQAGTNPHSISLAPRTQLIRRRDRPPGLCLETTVVGGLSESTTPPPWLCSKRGASRDGTQWKKRADEFSLPNVPGASGSPTKHIKKKFNINQEDAFSPRTATSRPPSESSRARFASNFPYM